MKLYKPLLHRIKLAKERTRQNSATKIQSAWRRFVCYSTYLIKRYENKAATTIQSIWRGKKQAKKYDSMYCAVSFIGGTGCLGSNQRIPSHLFTPYLLARQTIKIQALVRGQQERSWHEFQTECATIIQASVRRFVARKECHNDCMVSILISAAAHSLRVRNAATRLQLWWVMELWKKKRKRAALVIERFFIYVKKEVEKEVKALKKKKKAKRQRRKIKQSDDYILERAWLGVADADPAASLAAAAPQAAAAGARSRRSLGGKLDGFQGRKVRVEEDGQSEVSGLTDLDFGQRPAAASGRSSRLPARSRKAAATEDDMSLEDAFRDLEAELVKDDNGAAGGRVKASRGSAPQREYRRRYDN